MNTVFVLATGAYVVHVYCIRLSNRRMLRNTSYMYRIATVFQSFGYESSWIRFDYLLSWIRIRIGNADPDAYPGAVDQNSK